MGNHHDCYDIIWSNKYKYLYVVFTGDYVKGVKLLYSTT